MVTNGGAPACLTSAAGGRHAPHRTGWLPRPTASSCWCPGSSSPSAQPCLPGASLWSCRCVCVCVCEAWWLGGLCVCVCAAAFAFRLAAVAWGRLPARKHTHKARRHVCLAACAHTPAPCHSCGTAPATASARWQTCRWPRTSPSRSTAAGQVGVAGLAVPVALRARMHVCRCLAHHAMA